jgi:hypothetical protein
MATMIPNDVEELQTEGERAYFRFLHSVAKPDSRYVVWYLPDVNGKETDPGRWPPRLKGTQFIRVTIGLV